MNSLDKLVYMANQIVRNLATMQPDEAAAMLADHVAHFWDPRMKSMIFDHIVSGGEGLSPVALAGLRQLAEDGAPAPQTRATIFNAVDGLGGSDAG